MRVAWLVLLHVGMGAKFKLLAIVAVSALTACAAQSDAGDDEDGDSQTGAWDAESATNEAESTHLWIVNHAITILAKHTDDPVAVRAASLLDDPICRTNWQQGLLDADFKAEYNNGRRDLPVHASDVQVALAGATWESHFFDPDTKKNYKGATSPSAYTEAAAHLDYAKESKVEKANARGCYELGLALHYYTDLTQPMHASNFTAVDRPAKLHSNIEGYAVGIQDRYPLADWSGKPTGAIDEWVLQTAKDAKPLFMQGVQAVVQAYKDAPWYYPLSCRNIEAEAWRFIERQHVDYIHCWSGHPAVDKAIGDSLLSAQDHTAKYIYLVAQGLPETESTTTPNE